MPLTPDEIRAEIRRLGPWHHDIELSPGIRTGAPEFQGEPDPALGTPAIIDPDANLMRLVGSLFPRGLAGRSFLDCACNGGGYLFAAARLGAGRCFGFDAREHWIRQAQFLGRYFPDADVAVARCSLAEFPALGLEPFDVTYFSGLFYHLPDPVAGLRIAADHTKELLVLNTAVSPGKQDALVLNQESRTLLMSGIDGLAWLPTGESVLRRILAACGFPHTRLNFDRPASGTWRRVEILAARDPGMFDHYDASRPAPPPGRLKRLTNRLRGLT
ncbi:MAG: tRNA (5-methoxyuridine) 34 synthase [Sphingomonas bacterium]|nr:tRNA (5-methoxyuridine) 34 synthase [Sphingomonas bacterium]